jgi:hypothetical protein
LSSSIRTEDETDLIWVLVATIGGGADGVGVVLPGNGGFHGDGGWPIPKIPSRTILLPATLVDLTEKFEKRMRRHDDAGKSGAELDT